jgi:hypothetical protein
MLIHSPTLAQTTFTKITQGDIVNDLGNLFVRGVWGDFNNDSFLDLFVNDKAGTNVLYLNNGNGTFTKVTQGDQVRGADDHSLPSCVDFDNDGNLDLLVPSGFGQSPTLGHNRLYQGKGDGTFGQASAGDLTNKAGYFGLGAWADYDNDGFVDVLIANLPDSSGGRNVLFHNNGDGTFASTASAPVTTDLLTPASLVWADYDNDGFMDLLVVNSSAGALNRLYHNERNGTFRPVLTNTLATDRWGNSGGTAAAWGDYDNDGFLDLFVASASGAPNRLYHNNGDGTFTKINSAPMLAHLSGVDSDGCAWGDYDNDGYLDLFVTSHNGHNQLFHNNGDGTFTQVSTGAPTMDGGTGVHYFAPSWVDYDNDGFLDLFVAGGPTDQGGAGKNLLYHNDGTTNNWIEIKLVGTVSNRSAIGAKVRALATLAGKRLWQLREINEGGGHSSLPLVAHFGLGDTTQVEVLRIEWPSGIVQEFQGRPANQILTIEEPSLLTVSLTNGVPLLSLKGGRGFQYQIQSSTNLATWATVDTLTITNLNGRTNISDLAPSGSPWNFYRAVRTSP